MARPGQAGPAQQAGCRRDWRTGGRADRTTTAPALAPRPSHPKGAAYRPWGNSTEGAPRGQSPLTPGRIDGARPRPAAGKGAGQPGAGQPIAASHKNCFQGRLPRVGDDVMALLLKGTREGGHCPGRRLPVPQLLRPYSLVGAQSPRRPAMDISPKTFLY